MNAVSGPDMGQYSRKQTQCGSSHLNQITTTLFHLSSNKPVKNTVSNTFIIVTMPFVHTVK